VILDLVWSPQALSRLQEIRAFIAKDQPDTAERIAMRIIALTETLRNHPHLGRSGSDPATRELVIGGTPYLAVYRVHRKHITILTVWHGAQRKPN
jgi:addiction module RelE/StbE family toxin